MRSATAAVDRTSPYPKALAANAPTLAREHEGATPKLIVSG
jgi:hypothetical protein